MDKVSVIIPVYNAGEKITDMLSQIKSQSCSELEIIVVDDGSEDDSLQIIKRQADKRFVVIEKKQNEGVSSARNAGLDAATGRYIVFPDADDIVKTDYIKTLLHTIKENDADMAVCGYERFGEDGLISGKSDLKALDGKILSAYEFALGSLDSGGICSTLWNKIYRADIAKKICFDERLTVGEDLIYNFEYAAKIRNAAVTDECLYGYYENPKGALKSIDGAAEFDTRRFSEWEALKKAAGMLKKFPEYKKADGAAMYYRFLVAAHNLYYHAKDAGLSGEYEEKVLSEMEKLLSDSKRKIIANKYINAKWKAKLLAGKR
ncbi:MAG: glycosyltransferase [Lachnospiraceae bacterium]|nr:glycosyltransferase [Lachnospiraceae bacterium]